MVMLAFVVGCGPTQAEKDLAARMEAAVSRSEAAANKAEAAARTAADAAQRADAAAQKAEVVVSRPCQPTVGGPCNTAAFGMCCQGINCVCFNQVCRRLFPSAKVKH